MRIILIFTLLSFMTFSHASLKNSRGSIAPENNLWIPEGDKENSGLTEEQFHRVLDRIFSIYIPLAKIEGAELKTQRYWKDGTVNSYAEQFGKLWIVDSFGGLARYNGMTEDAFALVTCHEIGHHMGGTPRKSKTWALISSEGQADYFATLKCMKLYLENEDNIAFISNLSIPEVVKNECQAKFLNQKDEALCIRSALSGKVLTSILSELGYEAVPDFSTPDKSVVEKTLYDTYPEIQCRLDTYFAGALCAGDCLEDKGARPACWYRAKN